MNENKDLSPLAAKMVADMSEFCDAIEAGEPISKAYTIRTVILDLEPKSYTAEDVIRIRRDLNASQALLAKFLGVSVKTLRSWEQGLRPVPGMACRYLDDIVSYPEIWRGRIRLASGQKTTAS